MILLNVIYVYLHTNQSKYTILSLFINFFFSFPHLTLFHFFSFNLFSVKGERVRGCNLPPPTSFGSAKVLSVSPPPPSLSVSVGPIFDQCQHASIDNLPTASTITQCWSNPSRHKTSTRRWKVVFNLHFYCVGMITPEKRLVFNQRIHTQILRYFNVISTFVRRPF